MPNAGLRHTTAVCLFARPRHTAAVCLSPSLGTRQAKTSFFRDKIATIRQSTASSPQPVIQPRNVPVLSHFDAVTEHEVQSLLMSVPTTSCPLDPIPTWVTRHFGSRTLWPQDTSAIGTFRNLHASSRQPISEH